MRTKIFNFFIITMCFLLCTVLLVGCDNPELTEYEEDVYDANGNLQITFFGIDIDSLQSPTKDTKLVLDYIEKNFKVKFNFISGSPDGWKTVLNQNIGGGDVPDIWFHEVDQPQYSSWLEDDYLMDFKPYLDDYPNIKASFERYVVDKLESYLGGGLYGFPIVLEENVEEDLVNTHGMYYRRDWTDKVLADGYKPSSGRELKDPEDPTFDYNNFYDLMEAFTKGDPDGNGQNDTYGLALTKDGGIYWWYPILSMFGVSSSTDWYWNETENKWLPTITSSNMKLCLDYLAKMYDNGLINSNYATTATTTRMKNDFINGQAGTMIFNTGFEHAIGVFNLMEQYTFKNGVKVKDMNDVCRGFPVITGVDGTKKMWGHTNKYGYRSISNFCSPTKREKILDIMEWMLSEEGNRMLTYGIEGTHYKIENSEIVSLLGKDSSGEEYSFYDSSIARGLYFLKGLVSWNTEVPKANKYYEETVAMENAWKQEYLISSKLAYCSIDSAYGITESDLNDMTIIAFQKYVGKTSASDREKVWSDFLSNYFKKGNSYINAMNRSAEELNIAH